MPSVPMTATTASARSSSCCGPRVATDAVEADSGLVGALAARDPGAAFDAAFAALLPQGD